MCIQCILGSIRVILHAFNVTHALIGLALLGVGAYMEVKYASLFSEIVMAVGAFVFISALIGIFAVYKKSKCLLVTYAIFMGALFLTNFILLIMTYTSFDRLLGATNSTTENWVQDHKSGAQYLLMGLVAVELLCLPLAFILYRRKEDPATERLRKIKEDHRERSERSVGSASRQPPSNIQEKRKPPPPRDQYKRLGNRNDSGELPRIGTDDL